MGGGSSPSTNSLYPGWADVIYIWSGYTSAVDSQAFTNLAESALGSAEFIEYREARNI